MQARRSRGVLQRALFALHGLHPAKHSRVDMRKAIVACMLLSLPLAVWGRDKPCSANPMITGSSFVVHGRLSRYNGSPTLRIWIIGTHRLLGVSGGRFYKKGYRNLPQAMEEKLDWDNALYGDFLIFPFTKSQAKVMQLVCIESVKNLVVQKHSGQQQSD